MSWTTAALDLRNLLSDGDIDKARYRKRVFGEVNGTNTHFKTFEFRRTTDFSTSSLPLGVWVSGVNVGTSGITSDSPVTGDFDLLVAPTDGQVVEASYYIQWFLDTEIINFLRLSTNWLGLGDDPLVVGQGLRPAALKYAASDAYQKLAIKWAEMLSEQFMLNDSPDKDKNFKIVDAYMKAAAQFRKDAEAVRDDFYSRSGREKQPLFGNNVGAVSDNVPKR